MAKLVTETVTHVHHWNESLFSFRTTRSASLRFENGHFLMVGLMVDNKPLMRAYSVASANYDDELEFFSIKVPDGPLTSRLQHIQVGDEVMVSTKATGTLIAGNLLDGENLYLLSTGTGLAPFLSIIRDPSVYEKFRKVILVHGVRTTSELAYQQLITETLSKDEFIGEYVREQLIYYPTVTREAYTHTGRLTNLMTSGQLFQDIGLPEPSVDRDRFMICGSPGMLTDTCAILDDWGFAESRQGIKGSYVIERAFVEQ